MGTWWIDEPRVLGSSNPTDSDLERLYSEGFRVVISLLDEQEQEPNYDINRTLALGFTRHSIPIQDFHAPTTDQIEEFVRLTEPGKQIGKVLVHCEGGSGRTGTIGAGYWVARGLSTSDAIQHVRHSRPHAVETVEQRNVLLLFERTRKSM